ncbi:hypothetical protein T492DRAFT_865735 [Pavlovales sp. CCMP2436]|nr:hypothetical protein T492DRAFT_865735 [Pavlovales sp. CCMP2436]
MPAKEQEMSSQDHQEDFSPFEHTGATLERQAESGRIVSDNVSSGQADTGEVVRWSRIAAEQGHANAAFLLSELLLKGGNLEEGADWLRRAADLGADSAQCNIGFECYRKGVAHLGEACSWFRRVAEQGHAEAAYALACVLRDTKDYVEAASWLDRAIELTDDEETRANAQFELSRAFAKGDGVPRDIAKALSLAGIAADQGHTEAQKFVNRASCAYHLAAAQAEQKGEHSDKRALELKDRYMMALFAAARELYGPAQLQIGHLYRQGHRFIMMQSDEEAVQWYRRAGIGKMAAAQVALAECFLEYVLGGFYLRGERGKPQDYTQAVCFFRLSAEQEHAGGLRALADC